MDSLSKQYTRVGILTTVVLLIFFGGYFFINNKGFFDNGTKLFVMVDDASNITTETQIVFRGLIIGSVNDLNIHNNKVMLKLSIDKDMKLPKSIELKSSISSVFGDKQIEVDNFIEGVGYYQSGDTIQSEFTTTYGNHLIDSTFFKDMEPTLKEISNSVGQALIDYSESIDTTNSQN